MNRADKLALLRNPNHANNLAMREVFSKVESIKGDPGRTPIKGVDYFTNEEITAFLNYLRSVLQGDYSPTDERLIGLIRPLIPAPVQGPKGEKGDSVVGPQGPAGAPGKDGQDAKHETIIQAVLDKLKGGAIEYGHLKGAPELNDVQELIKYLKRGGFRGGGGSSSVSGATPKYVDLSSQCDGVTKSFTIPAFTSILGLQGSDAPFVYRPTVDFTAAGLNLALAAAVPAPTSGATLIFQYV